MPLLYISEKKIDILFKYYRDNKTSIKVTHVSE